MEDIGAALKIIAGENPKLTIVVPAHQNPLLVVRNNTERPEAVDAGTVKLIGTDRDRIVAEVTTLLNDQRTYQKMAQATNPYGDGKGSLRAAAAIAGLLGVGRAVRDFRS